MALASVNEMDSKTSHLMFLPLCAGLIKLDLTNANINNVDAKSFSSLSATLTELLLDNIIITTADLENIFAGLVLVETSTPSTPSSSSSLPTPSLALAADDDNATSTPTTSDERLETLSLNNVFVGDNSDTKINSHLFHHLGQTRFVTVYLARGVRLTLRYERKYIEHRRSKSSISRQAYIYELLRRESSHSEILF